MQANSYETSSYLANWLDQTNTDFACTGYYDVPCIGKSIPRCIVCLLTLCGSVAEYNYNYVYPNEQINFNNNFEQQLPLYGTYSTPPQPDVASPITTNQDDLDLLLDDIIGCNSPSLSCEDEFLNVLSVAGLSDLLDDDNTSLGQSSNSSNSSNNSNYSPKRKYSLDSSEGCSTENSFPVKAKRVRRSKHSVEEKVERKKGQNKKAATKYRYKKKTEQRTSEQVLDDLQAVNNELSQQFNKLKCELDVILPLAKAAFSSDPTRSSSLEQIMIRLNSSGIL